MKTTELHHLFYEWKRKIGDKETSQEHRIYTLKRAPIHWPVSLTVRDLDVFMLEGFEARYQKWLKGEKVLARSTPLSPEKRKAAQAAASRSATVRREKIAFVDKLVDLLDLKDVYGKPLGDCTRADLLRAAVRSEEAAKGLTMDATLYRQLAAIIGDKTVRQATDRKGIVALITHRYEEETAA